MTNQPPEPATPEPAKTPDSESGSKQMIPLVEIINIVGERYEPLVKLITTVYERRLAQFDAQSKLAKHLSMMAAAIILVIVGSAAVLTYIGKMDGSSFGILLGVVVGYLLNFIRDALKPKAES